jgi:HlyD family secretion protein
MKIVRWTIAAMLMIGIVGLLLWWWSSQTIAVDVASVSRGSLIESIVVDGISTAENRTTVLASVTGLLEEVPVHSGDAISKDTLLATIAPVASNLLDSRTREAALIKRDAARAEYRRAITNRETAESNLKSVQKRRSTTPTVVGQTRPVAADLELEEQARKRELDSAERVEERALFELNAALVQLGLPKEAPRNDAPKPTTEDKSTSTTKDNVDSTTYSEIEKVEVRPSTEGHVLRVLRSDSGIIAAGTPIMEVGNLKAMEFVFNVLTTEASRIQIGTKVQLRRWGHDERSLQGRVTKIEAAASRHMSPLGVEEHRVRVIVALENGESLPANLGDGFRIEGVFQLRENFDVLKVPLGAVYRKEGAWFVFRVKDGRALETKVELGSRNEHDIAVVSGLTDYDLVILFPANRIENGVKVHTR